MVWMQASCFWKYHIYSEAFKFWRQLFQSYSKHLCNFEKQSPFVGTVDKVLKRCHLFSSEFSLFNVYCTIPPKMIPVILQALVIFSYSHLFSYVKFQNSQQLPSMIHFLFVCKMWSFRTKLLEIIRIFQVDLLDIRVYSMTLKDTVICFIIITVYDNRHYYWILLILKLIIYSYNKVHQFDLNNSTW